MIGRTKVGRFVSGSGSSVGGGRPAATASTDSPHAAWGGHNKGFGLRPDADQVLQEVYRPEPPLLQIDSTSGVFPPTLVRTQLFAIPILNGDSYNPLSEFFEYRAIDLDEASGVRLHFLDVGDPRKSGPIWQGLQSEAERAEDERLGQEFASTVHVEGRTHDVRLRQMKRLAALLKVDADAIPCLVFMRPGTKTALEVFTLQPEWWATQSACRAFSGVLQAWLSRLNLSGAAPIGAQGDRLAATLAAALDTLTDEVDQAIGEGTVTAGAFVFQREGTMWRVVYESKASAVTHCVGMDYLKLVLESPEREIPARALQLSGSGCEDQPPGTGSAILDHKSRAAGEKQLREVTLRLAGEQVDSRQTLEKEAADIKQWLASGIGLGGRHRRANDDHERARKAVSNAINRAITVIGIGHPELAAHLKRSVKRGTSCSYRPDRPVPWRC